MTDIRSNLTFDRIMETLSSAYACALLSIFLLFVPRGGYSVIADSKYTLFLILSLTYLTLSAVCIIHAVIRKKSLGLRGYFTPACIAALLYLLFSAISAVLSPYGTETLLGGSRRDGLLTVAIYVFTFLLLSRHFRPKPLHLALFAFSATFFSMISLLQFEGFNPLSLYPEGMNYYGADIDYAGTYIGTVGNADLAAPILAGGAAVFAVSLFKLKDSRRFLLLIPLTLSAYILIKINVTSALLAIAVFILFVPPILVSDAKSRKICIIFSSFLTVFGLFFIIFGSFSEGFFYEFSEFLKGNGQPHFGSGRLSIWSPALEAAENNLLFGTGPDTFRFLGLKFEWLRPDGTVSVQYITAAHNDYLNILVNQGLAALLAYLAMLSVLAVKFCRENPAFVTLSGCFAFVFALQIFFGISMPVNMPFFWLALAAVNNLESPSKG